MRIACSSAAGVSAPGPSRRGRCEWSPAPPGKAASPWSRPASSPPAHCPPDAPDIRYARKGETGATISTPPLLIGRVQIPPAAPDTASSTARAMTSITVCALAGSGRPARPAPESHGSTARTPFGNRIAGENTTCQRVPRQVPGSPRNTKGTPAARPSAPVRPDPAGSPQSQDDRLRHHQLLSCPNILWGPGAKRPAATAAGVRGRRMTAFARSSAR